LDQSNKCATLEKYLNEAPAAVLGNRKLVAIDPNLSDLLYCVTKDGDRVIKLRYTENQRRKETKSKKYMKLIKHFKETTLIDGQNVIYWETQLSQYNHKSLRVESFQSYVNNSVKFLPDC
jgi:hypothetical protein